MAEIFHQVGVAATIDKVYQALTTLEGLSFWWTKATGNTTLNNKLVFHFGEQALAKQTIEMTIQELIPNKKVVWRCTEKEGEWKDTIISYDLVETNEQVFVNFSHTGWSEQTELCSHCNTKWAMFLISLKDYLETGTGRPFPNDIQVNHLDG